MWPVRLHRPILHARRAATVHPSHRAALFAPQVPPGNSNIDHPRTCRHRRRRHPRILPRLSPRPRRLVGLRAAREGKAHLRLDVARGRAGHARNLQLRARAHGRPCHRALPAHRGGDHGGPGRGRPLLLRSRRLIRDADSRLADPPSPAGRRCSHREPFHRARRDRDERDAHGEEVQGRIRAHQRGDPAGGGRDALRAARQAGRLHRRGGDPAKRGAFRAPVAVRLPRGSTPAMPTASAARRFSPAASAPARCPRAPGVRACGHRSRSATSGRSTRRPAPSWRCWCRASPAPRACLPRPGTTRAISARAPERRYGTRHSASRDLTRRRAAGILPLAISLGGSRPRGRPCSGCAGRRRVRSHHQGELHPWTKNATKPD